MKFALYGVKILSVTYRLYIIEIQLSKMAFLFKKLTSCFLRVSVWMVEQSYKNVRGVTTVVDISILNGPLIIVINIYVQHQQWRTLLSYEVKYLCQVFTFILLYWFIEVPKFV